MDIVKFIAGSPDMVVTDPDINNAKPNTRFKVSVAWFNSKGTHESGRFYEEYLVLSDSSAINKLPNE